ncbi:MAG: hypothetical protein IJW34_09205 [Clostridia bacterium]|nr:hypothetical protein [Clostridia bacterium]
MNYNKESKMKKLSIVLLAIILCISMCACGPKTPSKDETKSISSKEISEQQTKYYAGTDIPTFDSVVEVEKSTTNADGDIFLYGGWDSQSDAFHWMKFYVAYLQTLGFELINSSVTFDFKTDYGILSITGGTLESQYAIAVFFQE